MHAPIQFADWVTRVDPSPTSALEARVAALLESGTPVWRLGLGEPDFPTPDHVKAAAIAAIEHNFTGYTNTVGIPGLRRAIASRLAADLGVTYTEDEIVASTGGKHALYNAVRVLCRAGDEVLVPAPYWVSYPQQVKLADGIPVFVNAGVETGFKVNADSLRAHLTSRSRMLIVNSPNNPTGAVYGADELRAIARLCVEHDLWVISDEVYSAFNYLAEGHCSIAVLPGMRERTVIVHAVSKTYGMTGWRIGFAAAPRAVAEAMGTLQSHVTSNPTSIAQKAAEAALTGPQDSVLSARADYQRRRQLLADGVRRVRGLECLVPDGAFYLWVDASYWLGRTVAGQTIATVDDLATVLLEQRQVAVVPGTGFGSPHHLRLSFAAPVAELTAGLERMGDLLGVHSVHSVHHQTSR